MRFKACSALLLAALLAGSLTACGTTTASTDTEKEPSAAQATIDAAFSENGFGSEGEKTVAADSVTLAATTENEWFTDRDLKQTADLTGAVVAELDAGQPVHVYAYDSLSAYVECDGQRGFAPVKFLKKPD